MKKTLIFVLAFCIHSQIRAADVDPLAELAALGEAAVETGPEGGGSIRAKKDTDGTKTKRLNDPKNLEARVESIATKDFPLVAVTLTVLKSAQEGEGKTVEKNAKIVITPKYKIEGNQVALKDPDTATNAGAYYLKKGDKVAVRLGSKKDKFWEAEYIERK